VSGAFSSIGFALSTSIAVAAARVRRVATAFAAAARRFRVVAAFLPAARRLRVAAALLPAARRFRVIADFFAAALRFRATFVLLAADDAIPINSFATRLVPSGYGLWTCEAMPSQPTAACQYDCPRSQVPTPTHLTPGDASRNDACVAAGRMDGCDRPQRTPASRPRRTQGKRVLMKTLCYRVRKAGGRLTASPSQPTGSRDLSMHRARSRIAHEISQGWPTVGGAM